LGRSLARFVAAGILLGLALWLAMRLSAIHLADWSARDETTLLVLIVVGALVYAGSILLFFGKSWLRSLVRG
jgi:putative peptidoglycan lipid II flippase